jgi:hypothetical protein
VSVTTLFGKLASDMQDDRRSDRSPYVPGLPLVRVTLKAVRTGVPEALAAR